VSSLLEDLVRQPVKARLEEEAVVPSRVRTNEIDVAQSDSLDDPKRVAFRLGQHRVEHEAQLICEFLEPRVRGRLEADAVLRHEDAPALVLGPVLPTVLLGHLRSGRRDEELLDLAGSFEGISIATELLLDRRNVLRHLAHGTKPNLA
jgi:hypothetical protein